MAIGYIGVFFAHLIKSAVSRQREYLADASAVQFTRHPSGIADALKKIGGLSFASKIQSPRAEESSHMFFGNALGFSLFATHPPLLARVQRIEPDFRGPFPKTTAFAHDLSEIIDPSSLAAYRASLAEAHQAAVEGADRVASDPERVVESVGEPQAKHIQHVHGLVDEINTILAEDLRDPLGAVAVIYGLLLAPPETEMRAHQLEQLQQQHDQRPVQELKRVLPTIDRLIPEQRLPVACMTLPALHQMSPPQVQSFYLTVRRLIQLDQRVSLFEYAVHRFIAKRLVARLREETRSQSHKLSAEATYSAMATVLSMLAHASGKASADAAFKAATQTLANSKPRLNLLERAACTLTAFDKALDQLGNTPLQSRREILNACSACVAADQHVTVEEAELLRVIADAFDCPVPPVLK
jgi:hypothetical protein